MPVLPYINFGGNCREAVLYYAEVFQTPQPKIMTYGEMHGGADGDGETPEAAKNLVMHTELHISGTAVMFSDVFPEMGWDHRVGNNISLTVVTRDAEEITRYFNRLKGGGTVHMDLQETFWTKLYGSLRDKYGVEWQFSLSDGTMLA
jgi:PhnB protein